MVAIQIPPSRSAFLHYTIPLQHLISMPLQNVAAAYLSQYDNADEAAGLAQTIITIEFDRARLLLGFHLYFILHGLNERGP